MDNRDSKPLPRDKRLKNLSSLLRNHPTKEERHLWYDCLRTYPVRFNRQRIIGRYIVDFYCSKAKLVVELDGSSHYGEKGITYDKERTSYLEGLGLKVIRFTNLEIIRHFEDVCNAIDLEVKRRLKDIT